MVFTGNPGTGKRLSPACCRTPYAAVGALKQGQFVEVDCLPVAGYAAIDRAFRRARSSKAAIGGVLFIDEAYSLAAGGENDFGREAIDPAQGHGGPQDELSRRHRRGLRRADGETPYPTPRNPGLESRIQQIYPLPGLQWPGACLGHVPAPVEKNGYSLSPEERDRSRAMFGAAL